MGLGRFRPLAVALAGITATVTAVALSPSAGTATSIRGAAFGQTSTVGALFARTPSGHLSAHFCTASVVDSPAGDLIITAAHCLAGRTPSQVAFVPDFAHGQGPYGVWTVSQIIADQQWRTAGNPNDDFAFLVVHQPGSKADVQSLTGGEILGIGDPAGRTVQVAGYPDGQDTMISCENAALDFSATQLQFDCAGFTDGTSGSPLLAASGLGHGDTVIGVIGGYQQGGDTDSVSYAAKFSTEMAALYRTALTAAGR